MASSGRRCAGALWLTLALGCGAQPADVDGPLNLIVISIDTLRADRLSCYGYDRPTTPNLDALAADAVVFDNASAPSSWTLPSHFSLLTGLYPTTHGVTLPTRRPSPDSPLLSETLGAAGWHPFALTGGAWLSAEYGFARGFREFEDERRDFAAVLQRAREYIELSAGSGRPYFAFLHTYDVHCPYDPQPPWDDAFVSADAEAIETAGHCGNPHYNSLALTPQQALHLSDQYDGSVRAADEALGDFFAFLTEIGELERTVVIVTSDHGEEFLEHGRIGHEATLYAEALLVPLIVRVPGAVPRRISAPVGLTDVVPTCLELLGLPVPHDLDGQSLVAAIRGETGAHDDPSEPADFRFAELDWNARLRSWIGRDLHLVEDLDTGRAQLFRRRSDPREQDDRSASEAELTGQLRASLAEFGTQLARGARDVHDVERTSDEPSADELELLRRLGYVISDPGE